MGFFNAAFRLGAVQGFQNRMEEIAEEQERLLKDDRRIAERAISSIENVKAKRKELDQNVKNMYELTKSIAEGADPAAHKNMLKQWALTHGSKINQSVAERLARTKSVEEINAFMPVEEPAPESPSETKEEESGPGFLASVFSPSARAAAQREKIFKKPAGVSDADWMAALADKDIPVYGAPSQPVATPEQVKDLQDFTSTDTNKAVALLATGFPGMTEKEIREAQTPKARLFGTIRSMLMKPDRTFEKNSLAREYNSGNITELTSDVRTLVDLTNDNNVKDVLNNLEKIGVKGTIKKFQEKDTSTPPNDTQSGQPGNNAQESDDMVENTAELQEKILKKLGDPVILKSLTDQDRQALKQPEVPKSLLDKLGI